MTESAGTMKMLRRKRICVYTHLFPVRSETFIREHVLGLVRRGHHVTVLAREPGGDILSSELGAIDQEGIERVYLGRFVSFSTKLTGVLNGLRAFLLALRYPRWFRIFRSSSPWTTRELVIASEAARLIANGRFDLVHVHYGDLAARLRLFGAGFSDFPPMVVTWHGYDVNAKPKVLGRSAYRELFSSAALHTVGSNFIRQRLIALGAREEAVARVPMGVDLARFSYVERRRGERDPLRILSVGRLEDVKGHSFLIEAVRRLKAEQIPVLLRIAGDGPLRAGLQAQIETSEVADRVELLGMVDADRIAREMRDAHLFALTGVETASGKVESQGVVFAEAQASGLPVVASRVGGIPESVIDGETGFLCPPADVGEIVRVIRLFAKDPDLARTFGRRGRRFVENNFSREGMMSNLDELYRNHWGE